MGRVRPFVADDIPAVVTLRQQSFRYTDRPSPQALAEYFRTVFFEGPWRDAALCPLVYEDGRGRVAGFLGVVPRSMVFRRERIRVAVGTQFMVAPPERAIAALELARAFLHGPQDLALADAANDRTRQVWHALGGRTARWYTLTWVRPLRPARYAATLLGEGRLLGALRRLTWGGLVALDATLTRLPAGRFAQRRPPGSLRALTPEFMVALLDAVTAGRDLVPAYDVASLGWLLEQLAGKRGLGALHAAAVTGQAGEPVGWFMYFEGVAGIAQTVQVAARPGHYGTVLDHLFHDAWRRGAIAVVGRLDPAAQDDLAERACAFRHEKPWVLVHSPRSDILTAIDGGAAFLTRLEGEWWLSF